MRALPRLAGENNTGRTAIDASQVNLVYRIVQGLRHVAPGYLDAVASPRPLDWPFSPAQHAQPVGRDQGKHPAIRAGRSCCADGRPVTPVVEAILGARFIRNEVVRI